MSGKLGGFSWAFTQERRTGEGCGPFREKQACRFSVNILFVCLFVLPYHEYENNDLPTMNDDFELPFKRDTIKSSELADFLKKCFEERVSERWGVNELMNVSGMG